MYEREGSVSTYMGNGLAIPHGTNDAKSAIKRTGISFVRYPEPIDWNGKPAEFVVGIAGAGKDHMALLTKIAGVFLNKDEVACSCASTPRRFREVLGNTGVRLSSWTPTPAKAASSNSPAPVGGSRCCRWPTSSTSPRDHPPGPEGSAGGGC